MKKQQEAIWDSVPNELTVEYEATIDRLEARLASFEAKDAQEVRDIIRQELSDYLNKVKTAILSEVVRQSIQRTLESEFGKALDGGE